MAPLPVTILLPETCNCGAEPPPPLDPEGEAEGEEDGDALGEADFDGLAEGVGLPLADAPLQVVPLSVNAAGTGLLPVQEPLKPSCTEPPAGSEAFQFRLATVTFEPLCVQVPFQPWVTLCPAPKEKPSVQPLIADALLTMVMLAPKPPGH